MNPERPVRMAAILAGTLGLAPLLAESASGTRGSASSAPSLPSISTIDIAKLRPLLAQSDDLAPPSSPDAIVTNPPPAPLAEGVPPPLPWVRLGPWPLDVGRHPVPVAAGKLHHPTDLRCNLHHWLLAAIFRRMGLGRRQLELGS
jgi:hypothetical protein